jgi:4-hydroxy-2-oxovalerate aldolase
MDVTLRDGSYAVNFQFSEYETEKICKNLYNAGIEYIEIGHGMGLDASSNENGLALCSDDEYLMSAQKSTPSAKYGMFCIPAYAKVESLEKMKEYGASFVRVGSNVTEIEGTEKYIKKAKKLGLEVMANYMKSYVVSPEEFAENVKKSESYGADVVYVVDSAGSMNRHDIEQYYNAIRKVSNIKIGFHGHNNLGLAVSNSLYASELGFDIVDASVLGIGRSAGNAATELYIGNLMKENPNIPYDLKMILGCAERYVRPLWKHNANALDLYCGISEFHTSYIKYIHKYASKYGVNPLDLIYKYSQYDKVNLDEEVLEQIAKALPENTECIITDFGFNEYIGNEQKR